MLVLVLHLLYPDGYFIFHYLLKLAVGDPVGMGQVLSWRFIGCHEWVAHQVDDKLFG